MFLGDNMITINMLSKATMVKGQGVASAYIEQVALIKEGAPYQFDVSINSIMNFDIYHYHTMEPGFYFNMRRPGVHVSYVHFLPTTLEGSLKLPRYLFMFAKWFVTKFYQRADYLVVVNPIYIDELEKLGVDREKVVYIPNFVSKKMFYKTNTAEATKTKYKIPKNRFTVLGVGQIQTRKGVLDFVDIARSLPHINFVWAGGFSFGPMTDGYEELKKVKENPPENVFFLGIVNRNEMNDIYNMGDLLFMPSYNELFPMSILEASNAEKPILLRDLDLYEAILFDHYLKGINNEQFIQQIENLRTNSIAYNEASRHSKQISDYYSREHVLSMWVKFYQEIHLKYLAAHPKKEKN